MLSSIALSVQMKQWLKKNIKLNHLSHPYLLYLQSCLFFGFFFFLISSFLLCYLKKKEEKYTGKSFFFLSSSNYINGVLIMTMNQGCPVPNTLFCVLCPHNKIQNSIFPLDLHWFFSLKILDDLTFLVFSAHISCFIFMLLR